MKNITVYHYVRYINGREQQRLSSNILSLIECTDMECIGEYETKALGEDILESARPCDTCTSLTTTYRSILSGVPKWFYKLFYDEKKQYQRIEAIWNSCACDFGPLVNTGWVFSEPLPAAHALTGWSVADLG